MIAILIALHVVAAMIWVGGMFFAFVILRPAVAEVLEPPLPARLWRAVLGRFLGSVWGAIVMLLATGYAMVWQYGGFAAVGWHIHAMHGLAWLMVALFARLCFSPYRHLGAALDRRDPDAAVAALGRVRHIVAVNLGLGLLVAVIATGGRFL